MEGKVPSYDMVFTLISKFRRLITPVFPTSTANK